MDDEREYFDDDGDLIWPRRLKLQLWGVRIFLAAAAIVLIVMGVTGYSTFFAITGVAALLTLMELRIRQIIGRARRRVFGDATGSES